MKLMSKTLRYFSFTLKFIAFKSVKCLIDGYYFQKKYVPTK